MQQPKLEITPLGGRLGAAVRGVDLSRGPNAALAQEVRRAILAHGVVVFPGQDLDDAGHRRFAQSLGEPIPPPEYVSSLAEEGYPEIGVLESTTGVRADTWHSDVTWMQAPPALSCFRMVICPEAGGDTIWACQVAAYQALSERMRTMLEGLTARHQVKDGTDHPVVITHPETGHRALFVNATFTRHINELSAAESQALLGYLTTHATRNEFTCRWRWSPGDVAVWDNRRVQHYAVYDYAERRRIHRIELAGERPAA